MNKLFMYCQFNRKTLYLKKVFRLTSMRIYCWIPAQICLLPFCSIKWSSLINFLLLSLSKSVGHERNLSVSFNSVSLPQNQTVVYPFQVEECFFSSSRVSLTNRFQASRVFQPSHSGIISWYVFSCFIMFFLFPIQFCLQVNDLRCILFIFIHYFSHISIYVRIRRSQRDKFSQK